MPCFNALNCQFRRSYRFSVDPCRCGAEEPTNLTEKPRYIYLFHNHRELPLACRENEALAGHLPRLDYRGDLIPNFLLAWPFIDDFYLVRSVDYIIVWAMGVEGKDINR